MVNICKLVEGTKRYFIYGIAVLGQYCYDMITEKYGGDLNISANDNIFSLSILFPLSNEDVKVR